MKLSFKNSGPTDGLIKWLKDFSVMSSSLLIEVDTKEQKFVSKAFTIDKALVKYSEISFQDCNLELLDSSDNLDGRLNLCIFLMLPKMISVCETFSTTDFQMDINFEVNQDVALGPLGTLVSPSINFKSSSLSMRIDEGSPSAFQQLPDQVFNDNVHIAPSPVSVTVTPEMIKNLIAISGILTGDPKKDFMIFEARQTPEGGKMIARDKESHYVYDLGNIEGSFNQVSAVIFREKFLLSMKGMLEDVIISISTSDPSRVLLDTTSGKTKTVISVSVLDENN